LGINLFGNGAVMFEKQKTEHIDFVRR